MGNLGFHVGRMASRPAPPVYIRQWIALLGRQQGEVARGAKVNEGYMSELCSGKKKHPTPQFLQAVAKELGISLSALMKKPPSGTGVGKLSPAQLQALGSLLDELQPEEED